MSSFIQAYRNTGNSILAYQQVTNCNSKSLKDIVNDSFSSLENVFEEVDFYESTESKRGILRNTSKIIGGIVSLGGSYMLEMHNKHYTDIYSAVYEPTRKDIESIERDTNESLSDIGEQLTDLNKLLKSVSRILKSKVTSKSEARYSLSQLDKFHSGFHTSLNAGFGGLVGGSTALGAWGLVSLVGSASTGTAISSLSGVAATNATLAWFGGGSIATGGAGMAGGFWVLGGIVAAPIVFFSTKNAYKKVDTLKEKKRELTEECEKLNSLLIQATSQLCEARKQQANVVRLMSEYVPKIQAELALFRKHRSLWNDLFGGAMKTQQKKHHDALAQLTSELLIRLGIR
ncbi:hypothetical protein [Vibrio cyclitrophicus]|uniref:hypothetical protein n=1 Tax=Vibrio cyclitrophicus TaxID=47951 RepID=UPI0003042B4B|nr:hypothetical protein [Vibrio cyclitrophicus]OED68633.1 hypothetical protein OAU_10960 [Vibrio cyclitrophicus ZF99]PME23807.1 hypothetical protein BCV43_00245 [Vibrio cyclitrophicus]